MIGTQLLRGYPDPTNFMVSKSLDQTNFWSTPLHNHNFSSTPLWCRCAGVMILQWAKEQTICKGNVLWPSFFITFVQPSQHVQSNLSYLSIGCIETKLSNESKLLDVGFMSCGCFLAPCLGGLPYASRPSLRKKPSLIRLLHGGPRANIQNGGRLLAGHLFGLCV